jgi:hypothetical protein
MKFECQHIFNKNIHVDHRLLFLCDHTSINHTIINHGYELETKTYHSINTFDSNHHHHTATTHLLFSILTSSHLLLATLH